jgi:hypothetical protein
MESQSTPKSQNVTFSLDTLNRFLPLQGWSECDQTPICQSFGQLRGNVNQNVNIPNQSPSANVSLQSQQSIDLNEKLSFIVNKLEKLDQNDKNIMTLTSNLTSAMNSSFKRIEQLEREKSVSDVYMKMIAYHSIDLEARSRRCNLIFYGLADLNNENTYDVLSDFFNDYLDLDLNDYYVQRVHRLGSLGRARALSQIPRRPIIVAFRDFPDTDFILNRASMLKGTRFGIDRDYPKEISNARKRLLPAYREERKNLRNEEKLLTRRNC